MQTDFFAGNLFTIATVTGIAFCFFPSPGSHSNQVMKTSHTEQQDKEQQQEGLKFLQSHQRNAFSKAFQSILDLSSVTVPKQKPTNLLSRLPSAKHKESIVGSQGKQLLL